MSPSWTKAHDSTKKLHMKPMQLSVCKQHAFPEILSLLSSKISPSHTPRSTLGCRACSGVSTNVIDVVSKGAHHGPKWKIIYVPQHDYSRCILPIPKQYDAWKPWKLWKLSFFSAMCSFLPLLWGPTCCRFLLLFIFLLDCPSRSPFVVCILIRFFLSLFPFWIHWYRLVVLDWPSQKGLVLQIYISTNLT